MTINCCFGNTRVPRNFVDADTSNALFAKQFVGNRSLATFHLEEYSTVA